MKKVISEFPLMEKGFIGIVDPSKYLQVHQGAYAQN